MLLNRLRDLHQCGYHPIRGDHEEGYEAGGDSVDQHALTILRVGWIFRCLLGIATTVIVASSGVAATEIWLHIFRINKISGSYLRSSSKNKIRLCIY
jgi:hypothetical protein